MWGDLDPEIELRLDVDTRLIKASDGATTLLALLRCLGTVRKFSDWTADSGRVLREGLVLCSENLAEQLASALFPAPEPLPEAAAPSEAPPPPA